MSTNKKNDDTKNSNKPGEGENLSDTIDSAIDGIQSEEAQKTAPGEKPLDSNEEDAEQDSDENAADKSTDTEDVEEALIKKTKVKTPKKPLINFKYILIFITILSATVMIYSAYKALSRRLMSVDERITMVEELALKSENMYLRLDNYQGEEYTAKFIEYLNFLIKHSPEVRMDLRSIFRKKTDYKLKVNKFHLSAGRSQKEYLRNIRKKLYQVSEYQKFLDEAKNFLEQGHSYKILPHKKLAKAFKNSSAEYSTPKKFATAKRAYSLNKASYQSYVNRLKEKINRYKLLRQEHGHWRNQRFKKKKQITNPEEAPETATENNSEKKPKELVKKEGLTDEQINKVYLGEQKVLKLEINELRKLKMDAYQKYRVSKKAYLKLKKAMDKINADK